MRALISVGGIAGLTLAARLVMRDAFAGLLPRRFGVVSILAHSITTAHRTES